MNSLVLELTCVYVSDQLTTALVVRWSEPTITAVRSLCLFKIHSITHPEPLCYQRAAKASSDWTTGGPVCVCVWSSQRFPSSTEYLQGFSVIVWWTWESVLWTEREPGYSLSPGNGGNTTLGWNSSMLLIPPDWICSRRGGGGRGRSIHSTTGLFSVSSERYAGTHHIWLKITQMWIKYKWNVNQIPDLWFSVHLCVWVLPSFWPVMWTSN